MPNACSGFNAMLSATRRSVLVIVYYCICKHESCVSLFKQLLEYGVCLYPLPFVTSLATHDIFSTVVYSVVWRVAASAANGQQVARLHHIRLCRGQGTGVLLLLYASAASSKFESTRSGISSSESPSSACSRRREGGQNSVSDALQTREEGGQQQYAPLHRRRRLLRLRWSLSTSLQSCAGWQGCQGPAGG